jgi:hypothetical protein
MHFDDVVTVASLHSGETQRRESRKNRVGGGYEPAKVARRLSGSSNASGLHVVPEVASAGPRISVPATPVADARM